MKKTNLTYMLVILASYSLSSCSDGTNQQSNAEANKRNFIAGCVDNGVPESTCQCMFTEMEKVDGLLEAIDKEGLTPENKEKMIEASQQCKQ